MAGAEIWWNRNGINIHMRGSVEMTKQKAKGIGDIVCGVHSKRGRKCPKHPEGHKYRGINKCFGCGYATWRGTGRPYGH